MACNNLTPGCGNTNNASITLNSGCPDVLGCPSNSCPDFIIRRRTTVPSFKVAVEDCDGPLDLQGENIVVEASMWAKARLKAKILDTDTSFSLADSIGFYQVMIDDIIVMDRIRSPEHMLVTGFNEDNKTITVQRGYNGTVSSNWAKGSGMRIFKFINAPATVEVIRGDVTSPDGIVTPNVISDTFLVYEWANKDTCLPGCYWLEFRVFEMELEGYSGYVPDTAWSSEDEYMEGFQKGWDQGVTAGENESLDTNFQAWLLQKQLEYEKWAEEARIQHNLAESDPGTVMVPDSISYISTDVYQCDPLGVKWSRKFPLIEEGFLIQITESATIL
jgi:hypothetical protein